MMTLPEKDPLLMGFIDLRTAGLLQNAHAYQNALLLVAQGARPSYLIQKGIPIAATVFIFSKQ